MAFLYSGSRERNHQALDDFHCREPWAVLSRLMEAPVIIAFKKYFTDLEGAANGAAGGLLSEIYAPEIHFQDPIHEMHGLERLSAYFEKLNANVAAGGFEFTAEDFAGDKAFLAWQLSLKLRRPAKDVRAAGLSVLTLAQDRVIAQRDYFDAGELFYENVPLLGGLIRSLKRKLAH